MQRFRIFLSTPSARRATSQAYFSFRRCIISIHALREEGDRNRCFRADRSADFYPRPPRGGRPVRFLLLHVQQDFYPRPPRGGRPRAAIGGDKQKEISIHALREEGDLSIRPLPRMTANFYPRPPRGGRPGQRHCADHLQNFYPRPPRGGRRSLQQQRPA